MTQPVPIQPALALLEEILTRWKQRGRETVSISAESLAKLKRLPVDLRQARTRGQQAPAQAQPATPALQPAPVQAQPVAPQVQPAPAQAQPVAPKTQPVSPQAKSEPGASAEEGPTRGQIVRTEQRGRVEILHPAGESKRERLVNLFFTAKESALPKTMPTLRDQMVFARGNPEARVVLVGEAPGDEEEKQKKPFVGPAGQKLDSILAAMGLNPETDVYISNIVKFRPKIGDGRFQGARNRKPTPEEMAACVKFVRSEIEVIQPRVIVALGGTAAEGLLELSGSVAGMRGKEYRLDGIPAIVTYHPAYLLRVESGENKTQALSEKRKVWEDMLRVMEILGLPISGKQRGFFTK